MEYNVHCQKCKELMRYNYFKKTYECKCGNRHKRVIDY